PRKAAGRPSAAGARQWSHQERTRRGHHSPRFLRGLAGGDDCRTRSEGGIREEIAAGDAGKSLREGEMKIGFIGLGMMGSGVAANLQRAGHELVVQVLWRG